MSDEGVSWPESESATESSEEDPDSISQSINGSPQEDVTEPAESYARDDHNLSTGVSSRHTSPSRDGSDQSTGELGGDWSGERDRLYDTPETDLELLKQVDSFLDEIDMDLESAKRRARAGEHYRVSDRVGNDITTQDKLGFDYVRDDGIVADGDYYIALSRVKPTRWISTSEEDKMNTMSAYAAFARSLQWGVSIPCYPAAFDFESYLDHIYEEGAKRAAVGTHPILDFARRFHIEYTSRRIDPKEVKKKEFYLVTRVNSNRVQAAMNSEGLVSAYATRLKASLGLADSGERSEQACVNELRTRQEEMHRRLARTGIEVTIINERRDAMELLYHYYNHAKPVLDSFDIGTRTSADFSGGA